MKRKVERKLRALKHRKRIAKRKAHRKPIALAHYRTYRAELDMQRTRND